MSVQSTAQYEFQSDVSIGRDMNVGENANIVNIGTGGLANNITELGSWKNGDELMRVHYTTNSIFAEIYDPERERFLKLPAKIKCGISKTISDKEYIELIHKNKIGPIDIRLVSYKSKKRVSKLWIYSIKEINDSKSGHYGWLEQAFNDIDNSTDKGLNVIEKVKYLEKAKRNLERFIVFYGHSQTIETTDLTSFIKKIQAKIFFLKIKDILLQNFYEFEPQHIIQCKDILKIYKWGNLEDIENFFSICDKPEKRDLFLEYSATLPYMFIKASIDEAFDRFVEGGRKYMLLANEVNDCAKYLLKSQKLFNKFQNANALSSEDLSTIYYEYPISYTGINDQQFISQIFDWIGKLPHQNGSKLIMTDITIELEEMKFFITIFNKTNYIETDASQEDNINRLDIEDAEISNWYKFVKYVK